MTYTNHSWAAWWMHKFTDKVVGRILREINKNPIAIRPEWK